MVIDTVFLKMALIDAGGDNGHVINIQIGKDRCIVGKRFLQPDAERLVAFDAGFGQIVFHAVGNVALGDGAEVNRCVRGEEG